MTEIIQEIRALDVKFKQLEELILAKEQREKDEFLTRPQLEEKLGISTRQVFHLIKKKVLKSYKFQNKIYFLESEVNAAIFASAVN